MDIYKNLPLELQKKIDYYVIEHPCAVMIKDKIAELKCNLYFIFKDKENNKVFCRIDGREFFCSEYFFRFNYEYDSNDESSIDNELVHDMFDVMSQTSSDSGDEGYQY